jgi:AMMECR1 domain-containing protein
VAIEYGWDRDTFLEHTCLKAGLAPDAWRDPGTKIEVFCADVLHIVLNEQFTVSIS